MSRASKAASLYLIGVSALGFAAAHSAVPAETPSQKPAKAAQAQAGPQQDAPQQQAAPEMLKEVVVTGTHIERPGFSAPTPTTVVGTDILEDRAPSTLIGSLALLPQFRKSATLTVGGVGTSNTGGGSFANLRGLGPNRTLVLLDGERIVPTTSIETVDISLLPESLVKRVDIVTGGASAAYGSDAVAGVANFILDTGFRGLKGDVQGGRSTYGDGGQFKGSLTWGADLGEHLHVISSVEYFNEGGVGADARAWRANSYGVIQNPAYTGTNGQAPLILAPNYYVPKVTFGGVILGGPLANTQFLPGGGTAPYVPCGPQTQAYIACNTAANLPWNDYADTLVNPVQRAVGFTRISRDLGEDSELYADGLVASSKTSFNVLTATTQLNGPFTIQRDNAFLPSSIGSEMSALGLTSLSLGRFSADFDPAPTQKNASLVRLSSGADIDLGAGWRAKAYGTYGQSEYDTIINNTENTALMLQSVDSVISPVTGQPVCRSTLTNPGNGCVPVDLFGNGSPSAAALAYFTGSEIADVHTTQGTGDINISGNVFDTWAGPVSVAFGGESRRERVRQTVDNVSLNNGWLYNNPKPLDGTIRVNEGYGEFVLPLAEDARFAHDLELNGAGRITHYNVVGTVETWKAGLTYAPSQDVRFRATRSRDIRAPNAVELFSPLVGAGAGVSVVDPVNNQPVLVHQLSGGNPALRPEIANSFTAGVVVQPRFLRGFSASLDYYDIRIKGAITTLNIQSIVNGCYTGNAQFCSLVVRNAAGALVQITNAYVNVNQMSTRGVDIDAQYAFDLGAPGAIAFRALGNYTPAYFVDSGTADTNFAGDMLNTGLPKWSADFGAIYTDLGYKLMLDASYIGGGSYNVLLNIQNNRVVPVWYLNSALEKSFHIGGDEYTAYFNIDNIFNRVPPIGFGNGGGPNYDHLGRYFKVGLRFKM